MKPKEQIREMGERFQIETPHVEYVADLSLQLFDGFGFDPADRPLLAAAARLHDIGYAADPGHHVEAGLKILGDNPLPAFSSKDWKLICLVVSLHRRDWRSVLTEEVSSEFSKKRLECAKTMAATLRIADGLDHSHIQDASIRFCRRGKKVDKVGVRVRWYENNITWAEEKSDLWEAVFRRSFRIKAEVFSSEELFKGVVSRKDSALSAARKIFYSQYNVMRDQVPGILEGKDPEGLHDYRVAMRRFRAALRLFRPLLRGTSAKELQKTLGELSDRMGGLRDSHVLLEFFKKLESNSPELLQKLEKASDDASRELAVILESTECAQTVGQLNRFLRVELPELGRKADDGPAFELFVRKRLKRLKQQIARAELTDRPEETHEVRKLCRRMRYIAEFSAPVSGGGTRQLARTLKDVAGTLGDLRDIHLHTAKLESMGFQSAEETEALRTKTEAKFSIAWKSLRRQLK